MSVITSSRILLLYILCFVQFSGAIAREADRWDRRSRYRSDSRRLERLYGPSHRMSKNKLRLLFAAPGALAGIYIANKMRPRVHLRTYHDLMSDDYSVCEGPRVERTLYSNVTYPYFLCPDNPDQLFNRFCCLDRTTGVHVCCSLDSAMYPRVYHGGSLIGGLIAMLLLLLVLGIAFTFCCCKRARQSFSQARMAFGTGHTCEPRVPTKPMVLSAGHVPPPYPTGNPTTAPVSGFGSAWTAPATGVMGSAWQSSSPVYPPAPPPPYSSAMVS